MCVEIHKHEKDSIHLQVSFFRCHLLFVFETSLPLSWNSISSLDGLAYEMQGITCLFFPIDGMTRTYCHAQIFNSVNLILKYAYYCINCLLCPFFAFFSFLLLLNVQGILDLCWLSKLSQHGRRPHKRSQVFK